MNNANSSKVADMSMSFAARFITLIGLVLSMNACDFLLGQDGSPGPKKDNPGINASIPSEFPTDATGNFKRVLTAERFTQSCPQGLACTATPSGFIEYRYDGLADPFPGRLNSALQYLTTNGSLFEFYREYIYSSPTRLDKVAVADDDSSNFHTLHHYTYDDEDDPSDFGTDPVNGYSANPDVQKLRMEYTCTGLDFTATDVNNIAADGEIECTRDGVDPDTGDLVEYIRADQAIAYIYYENGYLYRKDFDENNDGNFDWQKIFKYKNGSVLDRVDRDDHYDGILDERNRYKRDDNDVLRVFFDNGIDVKRTRGIDVSLSYRLGEDDGEVLKECYFDADLDDTKDGEWEAGNCTDTSRQDFHWVFTWEDGDCWVGGLDDLEPENRVVDLICKDSD